MSAGYAILKILDIKNLHQEIVTVMKKKEGKFGFTNFAEILNGRLAMIGFISAIILELNTGHGVLKQLGLM